MYFKHRSDFEANQSSTSDFVHSRVHTRPAREIPLKLGQTLYHQGDPVEMLYEVVRGVVRLAHMMPNGQRRVMAFGYPGDIIGFPQDGLHRCICEVIAPGSVIPHRREALESASADPELRQRLLDAALTEIGVMQDHFLMLGCRSALEKMASFLVALMQRFGASKDGQAIIQLPMCRSDIADYLGLTTETVSRMISLLRASRVITLESAQTIVVLKPVVLCGMSEGE